MNTPQTQQAQTAAVPSARATDEAPRCWRCGRKLAELVSRPWSIRCRRCHAQNRQPA
jgi:hypothetical protein